MTALWEEKRDNCRMKSESVQDLKERRFFETESKQLKKNKAQESQNKEKAKEVKSKQDEYKKKLSNMSQFISSQRES